MSCRRAIRMGAVNRVAVMDDYVPRLHFHRDLAGSLLGCVVGDALRESKGLGRLMGTHAIGV